MLVIAGYCAARLVVARRRRLAGTGLIDAAHVVMGTAMTGMFVPALLLPVPLVGWLLVFAVLTAAFLPPLGRALAAGRGGDCVRHLDHVLVGAAMLVMLARMRTTAPTDRPGVVPITELVVGHHGTPVTRLPSTGAGAGAGAVADGGSALLVTAALLIAAYLVMAAVRQALAAFRSARTMARQGPGEAGWFMAPAWGLSGEAVMAGAMVVMLWAV